MGGARLLAARGGQLLAQQEVRDHWACQACVSQVPEDHLGLCQGYFDLRQGLDLDKERRHGGVLPPCDGQERATRMGLISDIDT